MEKESRSSRIAPVLEAFAALVRADPSAIAIADETLRLSRRELYDAALRLAATLVDVAPAGTPIGLYLANDATFAVGALACVAAGFPHVALDVHYPATRNAEIAEQAGIGAVIERQHGASTAASPGSNIRHVALDEHLIADGTAIESALTPPPRPLELDDPFVLLYTSGSTGVPKGVAHSQRSLLHSVYPDIDVLGLSERDRSLGLWSPSTIAGLRAALSALLSGAPSIVRDPRSGLANVVATMRDERITIARAVPALVRAMAHVEGAREAMQHLRVLQLGGERVYGTDIELLRPVLSDGCKISIGFGSTEAGIVAQWFVSGDIRGVVPCGFAVSGTTLQLIAPDGSPAAAGAAGELRSTGPATALGFWRNGCVDAEAFPILNADTSFRSYATGDLFRQDEHGRYVHAGRIDRMLKIRGQRVDLGDVEAAVRRCAGVREAAVIARECEGALSLVAFVVFDPAAYQTIDTLRTSLRSELPAHMVPSETRCLEEIPHLPGFKPDFAALEKLAALPEAPRHAARTETPRHTALSEASHHAALSETPNHAALPEASHHAALSEAAHDGAASTSAAQSDAVSLAVTQAWNQTLGKDAASRNARWDDAGGDSLKMLLLAFRIERRLGRPVSFAALAPDMRPSDLIERLRSGTRDDIRDARVPTLVLCPGLEGDEPRLVRFRSAFGHELPVFVPEYLPWQAAQGAVRMGAIVDDVVEQIVRNVHSRPMLLAGYSFGGFVAHEAARRLAMRGEDVAFVGLLDTDLAWHEPYERKNLPRRIAQFATDVESAGFSRTIARELGFRLARIVQARPLLMKLGARFGNRFPLSSEARFFFNYRMTWYVRSVIAKTWTPNMLDVPVTLFRARANVTDANRDLGWRRYTSQLGIEEVDGSHFSMIEGEEGQRLAKILADLALRRGAVSL